MKIRPFTPEDYPMVCEWWKYWRWDCFPLEWLPPFGAIISDDDHDICAAWLHRTDTPIALLEWYVSNPEAKDNREAAIKELTAFFCDAAQELGFEAVMVMAKNKHLINKLSDMGFTGEQDGMTHMIRIL